MAHELENDRSMIYVGETPWHKLGIKLDSPPTTREAIVAAGMDWEVGVKPLQTTDGQPVRHQATYRMSDNKILGVVGPAYHPIQNSTAFEWFDPFVTAGEASIETAGSLFGGQRIWILARLNRTPSVIVPGDEVQKYILLANSHDGSLAGRVGFTPVRVVCNNTLSMATDSAESKLIRIRHTKNAKEALEGVRDIMNVANASFEATAEQYRLLASKQVNADDLQKYLRLVFPLTARQTRAAKASSAMLDLVKDAVLETDTEVHGRAEKITELFENGVGNRLPGVMGTYWAAYNAVTEYTTHHRGRSDETRLQAMFNSGAAINKRALTSGLALAA